MARKFFTQPLLTEADARRIVATLRLKNEAEDHKLADKIERTLAADLAVYQANIEAAAAEEALRASRAANATLTKRQAECLAAVRAGKHPYDKPYYWTDEQGVQHWRWSWTRSMGGAINRMIETLVEEGLLTERNKLTEGGLARLEAWEAKHGRIGEVE